MNSALKTWQEKADVSKHDFVHLQFLWCTLLYAQEIEQQSTGVMVQIAICRVTHTANKGSYKRSDFLLLKHLLVNQTVSWQNDLNCFVKVTSRTACLKAYMLL